MFKILSTSFLAFVAIYWSNLAMAQSVIPKDSVVFIQCTEQGKPIRKGSGVFISEDGFVLTAKHVVLGSKNTISDSLVCEGSIRHANRSKSVLAIKDISIKYDAAILKFPENGQKFVQYCKPTESDIGRAVFATGFPRNSQTGNLSPRQGILSSSEPTINGKLETDAATTTGLSGGPVIFKDSGLLIGTVMGADIDQATGLPGSYGVLAAYLLEREFGTWGLQKEKKCKNKERTDTIISDDPQASITLKSDVVSEEIVFRQIDSPIKIDGHYQISPSGKLIIEKGVIIEFTADSHLTIFGEIFAVGTRDAPIQVKGNISGVSNGVRIYSKFPEDSSLRFINFERNSHLSVGYNFNKKKNQVNPEASIKSSLDMSNLTFRRSALIGEWGSDFISINLQNSSFVDSEIHAQYPYSPEITIGNSKLSYTKLNADNYARRGIHVKGSLLDNTTILVGCCSASVSLENSKLIKTSFQKGSGSPVNGDVRILTSKLFDLNYNLPNSTLIVSNSHIHQRERDFIDIGVHTGVAKFANTCLSGFNKTTALSIYGNHDRRGKSELDDVNILRSREGISVSSGDGMNAYDVSFYEVSGTYISNSSPNDLVIRTMIHNNELGNLDAKIKGHSVNFSAGKVIVSNPVFQRNEPSCP